MLGNYPKILIPDHRVNPSVFDLLGSSKMDVLRAAARSAYGDSPSIAKLFTPETLKHIPDPEIQLLVRQGCFETKKLSQEEFEEKYANTGLQYDPNMTERSVDDLIIERKQREINDYIISKGKGGLVEAIGKFGVEVIASNLNPINIAASFIPIGGGAWWSASALKYGAFKTAIAKGFVSGSVGQLAIEPFIYRERKIEQRDYGLKQSTINILESGLFGGALNGLGYGFKKLRDKYYVTPEQLHSSVTTNSPALNNQLKENINNLASNSCPDIISSNPDTIVHPEFSVENLQQLKQTVRNEATSKFPEVFKFEDKVAALEEILHQEFKTSGDKSKIPAVLLEQLQEHQKKVVDLYAKYSSNPEFSEINNRLQNLDQQIINKLKLEQQQLNAYNLAPEDLYIARSQLNDGKHIELDNPELAESFYENAEITANIETPNLQEHLASLEGDIATLSETVISDYQRTVLAEDEILKLTDNLLVKIKQGADIKDLANDFKILSLIDNELAGNLKTLHKELTGNLQLATLEKNRQIDQFFNEFKEQSWLKKRDYALNLIEQSESEKFVRKHANKVKGVKEYLRQVDLRQETISKELLFGLIRDLEQASLIKEFASSSYNNDIVQELWNITHPEKKPTGSNKAKEIAGIIYKWQTQAINRANLAGAYITPLEGYITKQTHNSASLRKAGYEEWLKFILPLLDHKKTGKLDFKTIFNNLATNTHLKEVDEYLNLAFSKNRGSNVADLVSASRKLHFKSADSWLKYQMEFGDFKSPNMVDSVINPIIPAKSFIAESIVGNLDRLGKSIGLLETMGTNPERTLKSLQTTFINELKERATSNKGIFNELETLKRSSKFTNQLELMLGVSSEVPLADSILSSYRSWKCISNLGSTVISSFPDAATFISELQNNGILILESYVNLLKVATTAFNAKEKKEFGQLLGVGVESMLGGSYSRLSAEYPVAGNIAKTTQAFFKLNCMQWWDNSWKSTIGNLLSHNLAKQVNLPFNSLYQGLQNLLTRYSIDESNWHLYKNLIQKIEGNHYLIPDSSLLPDHVLNDHLKLQGKIVTQLNRTRLKQDLTNNLRRYLIDRVDTAIPTPHTAEKAAMQLGNLGVKAGSPIAAVIQCIMQFKTFAYSYMIRPLKAITIDQIPIHEQRGYGLFDVGTWQDLAKSMRNPATLTILPQLLLGTTGLGYLAINAARLLRGQELLKPNEQGVFAASLLKGGGLGLYGDFIFGEFDRYNHNLLEALVGSIGGDIIDIGKIYSKAKNGETERAEELTKKLLKRNIPSRNLFYLQPALFMLP